MQFTPTKVFTNPLDTIKHMWNNRFTHMSITGGEPTTCMARTNAVAALAKSNGIYVGLRTANRAVVQDKYALDECVADDIVFGIHTRDFPKVYITDRPVYAQLIYVPGTDYYKVCQDLYELGYQGLTLMESWPYRSETKVPLILEYSNFSVRVLRCADVNSPFDVVCHTDIGKIEVGTGHLVAYKRRH
jgi:hypothetical protein